GKPKAYYKHALPSNQHFCCQSTGVEYLLAPAIVCSVVEPEPADLARGESKHMPITRRGLKDHNPVNGVLDSYHRLLQELCSSATE
ncbi:hypothetical protein A2U01_0032740, partial [Trifolium medium]|nr:hypothetical protein [Trifolium medium]